MAFTNNHMTERMTAKRSIFDWVLEAIALVVLFAVIANFAVHWNSLPALVPQHFGISGKPDGWGSKSGLTVLPLTAIGIYVLLSFASQYHQFLNVPMGVDRNAPHVHSLLLQMSIVLKLILLCAFLFLSRRSVDTALGKSDGLGRSFLPLLLAATFLPVSYYLLRLRKRPE